MEKSRGIVPDDSLQRLLTYAEYSDDRSRFNTTFEEILIKVLCHVQKPSQ